MEKFEGVKQITANLFLDNVWPAILSEGKLHVNLITQMYFDYDQFKEVKDKMPAELAERLEVFYNMDWANYGVTSAEFSEIKITLEAEQFRKELDALAKKIEEINEYVDNRLTSE